MGKGEGRGGDGERDPAASTGDGVGVVQRAGKGEPAAYTGAEWAGMKPTYLVHDLDADQFKRDIKACVDAVGEEGQEDADHFHHVLRIVTFCQYFGHILAASTAIEYAIPDGPINNGYATFALAFIAAFLISTGRCAAWVVVGHHAMHGGYTGLAKKGLVPDNFKRGTFAIGMYRRLIDWVDWMLPEAWNLEHNKLHHYQLSEDTDPDCVERNFAKHRAMKVPMWAKWLPMPIFLVGWKYIYYSTNCLKQLKLSQKDSWVARNWPTHPGAQRHSAPLVVQNFFGEIIGAALKGEFKAAVFWTGFLLQWMWTVTPMVIAIVWLPLALSYAGGAGIPGYDQAAADKAYWLSSWVCLIAELGTNAHTFIIVACNHAGDDLFRFSTSCSPGSAEFLLRCAYAGVNFETGTDFIDIMYGWLNYQIEHHMFPDMTHLQYRKLQPLVKEVFKKHKVLYIQENAFWRTWKTFNTAVGNETMGKCTAVLPPGGGCSEKMPFSTVSGGRQQ